MAEDPARTLKGRLRADLKAALKQGLKPEISLIRALLAALDNAEAPAQSAEQSKETLRKFGEGSVEVTRLTLTGEHVAALLRKECETRERAAAELEQLGQADRARTLRKEAEIVRRYLA